VPPPYRDGHETSLEKVVHHETWLVIPVPEATGRRTGGRSRIARRPEDINTLTL